jgi:hypothetical protein
MDFLPHFDSATANRSVHHFKDFGLRDGADAPIVGAIINSTLFYIWFIVLGNGRNVALRDITSFPVPDNLLTARSGSRLPRLFKKLMTDYQKHSVVRTRKDGVSYQEFYPAKSKPIMDEIDVELANHYEFSPEELDFILNYDIKYRLGADVEDE